MVQDGAKKRPTLEINPDTSRIVKRIFDMADAGRRTLDITRTLNSEGIASPRGELWGTASVHNILRNETYTGTLLWGMKGQGQRRAGAGGEGVSPHHLQGPVPPRQPATAPPRSQGQQPPESRKLLPAQRPHQVQGVQHPPSTVGSPKAASTPTTFARRTSISARTPARPPASTPAASRSWS